jgi:hypothetical protein
VLKPYVGGELCSIFLCGLLNYFIQDDFLWLSIFKSKDDISLHLLYNQDIICLKILIKRPIFISEIASNIIDYF